MLWLRRAADLWWMAQMRREQAEEKERTLERTLVYFGLRLDGTSEADTVVADSGKVCARAHVCVCVCVCISACTRECACACAVWAVARMEWTSRCAFGSAEVVPIRCAVLPTTECSAVLVAASGPKVYRSAKSAPHTSARAHNTKRARTNTHMHTQARTQVIPKRKIREMEQILQLPLDEVRRSEWQIVRAGVCACVCTAACRTDAVDPFTYARPQVVLLARDFLGAAGDDGFLDHDSFAGIAQRRLGVTKRQVARTYGILDHYQ